MISKIGGFVLRNLFKFPIVIGLISYSRFIFFIKIKKNFKTLFPLDDEIINLDIKIRKNLKAPSTRDDDKINKIENLDHKSYKEMSFTKGDSITALNTNLWHVKDPFKNIYYNITQRFTGQRSTMLIAPLKSLDFVNFKNAKVLSVGPRTESEIFNLVGHGFKLKNIEAIDLQSYSKVIKLGDLLDIPFENDKFDIVICGWVLSYTNKVKKGIDEMIRVTKNNGIICIGISDHDTKVTKESLSSSGEIINYFGENLKEVYFKYHPKDLKNRTTEQNKSYRSVVIVEIKK